MRWYEDPLLYWFVSTCLLYVMLCLYESALHTGSMFYRVIKNHPNKRVKFIWVTLGVFWSVVYMLIATSLTALLYISVSAAMK